MKRLLLVLMVLAPTGAAAGTRAVYAGFGRPMTVEIADNGDINAVLGGERRLILRERDTFIIQDRLTGPLVTRLEDLVAVAAEASNPVAATAVPDIPGLIERGTLEVNGRTGRAFYGRHQNAPAFLVVSDDPALAPLGAAMRRLWAVELLLQRISNQFPPAVVATELASSRQLGSGAPLLYRGQRLRALEHGLISAASFALPAAPETRDALRARLAAEASEARTYSPDRMILRAAFADGRLWLLADNGALSSLAAEDTARTRHDPGGPVMDICATRGTLVALTGQRDGGDGWTAMRWQHGRWTAVQQTEREGDRFVAMACDAGSVVLLTDRRLVDLGAARTAAVTLSEPLRQGRVRTVLHVGADAVFVGFNSGEWGGGLRRIDRRSGRITAVERREGDLCDGPINGACNPVNAIAPIPWRPGCVAVAIGLVHFFPSGRIASVCPGDVAQLYAAAGEIDPEDNRAMAQAARGGIGSVPFYGLAVTGDGLTAVGGDGLYRMAPDGSVRRRPWPRFREVDGLLVSFALPDAVLVLSELNRRASVSGLAPLIAPR